MTEQAAIKNRPESEMKSPIIRRLRFILPIILACIWAYFNGLPSRNLGSPIDPNLSKKVDLGHPDPLMAYTQFKARYPRKSDRKISQMELINRHLLFNGDLLKTARHNLACLNGKTSYYTIQSPLKSDRMINELDDVLNQLDDFDYVKMRKAAEQSDRLNSPVSGGHKVETGNKIDRWFTRLINGKSYFEIPNFPLDQQPDPSRVTHIDADLRDCTKKIQNQRECGACYAFSWNSLAEWHFCKQTGSKIDFSEQHIVDCGHKAGLHGCEDGHLKNVRSFSAWLGFHLEQDYPYTGREGRCVQADGSVRVKVNDFTRVKVDRAEWEELLKEQPILLEAHLPRDILSYKRGVHPGNNCDKSLAHGMLLVGHGRQDGVPYWLLMNSMGENWGENGYLRLSRDAPINECFRTGFISKFKFDNVDEDKYLDFYEKITFEPSVQAEIVRKGNLPITKYLMMFNQ